jgi:hypothetical protein
MREDGTKNKRKNEAMEIQEDTKRDKEKWKLIKEHKKINTG